MVPVATDCLATKRFKFEGLWIARMEFRDQEI